MSDILSYARHSSKLFCDPQRIKLSATARSKLKSITMHNLAQSRYECFSILAVVDKAELTFTPTARVEFLTAERTFGANFDSVSRKSA